MRTGAAVSVGISVDAPTIASDAFAVGTVAAVPADVRIKLVRFPGPFVHIVAERVGLRGLLVCVLAQPSRVDLRLLCVRLGAGSLRFPLPGVKFLDLGLAANFCSLLPVRVVPLLLYRLPAPSAYQQEQHNQHYHNNGNYHPNPWSCFQITHHFPLDATGAADAFPADSLEPL
jgi:hypothetical protein